MSVLRMLLVFMVLVQCVKFSTGGGEANAETYGAQSTTSPLFNEQQESTTRPEYNPLAGPNYPIQPNSYFTDDNGNILMMVNVLGEVHKPGQIVVRENADFSTVVALAGGQTDRANMKKVVVARQEPDAQGKQSYKINLKEYFKTGNRADFITLRPNDTIFIPDKKKVGLEKIATVIGTAAAGFSIFAILQN
ncbi:polysaccharide biosynthesis/export family protein [Pelodictyon luteolum]|uniref:Soluble ligand binding domain-containing protein n=1 Tax=Chlorobium luteolum (strain DSM 273 / BCRC 81028 / 2530) TaxID=319225 RepID=Q3B4U5_CHLL3|nr:SLBB domain-containing protein [Pelodictyon luteolum]ABB23636.1 hypothetical protein Plut_0763 [Pelodictyon luteolum DSM 273]